MCLYKKRNGKQEQKYRKRFSSSCRLASTGKGLECIVWFYGERTYVTSLLIFCRFIKASSVSFNNFICTNDEQSWGNKGKARQIILIFWSHITSHHMLREYCCFCLCVEQGIWRRTYSFKGNKHACKCYKLGDVSEFIDDVGSRLLYCCTVVWASTYVTSVPLSRVSARCAPDHIRPLAT
jgi:hypothetical protein